MRGLVRFLIASLVAAAAFIASNLLGPWAVSAATGVSCISDGLSLQCAYPEVGRFDAVAYSVLFATFAGVVGISYACWRRSLVHPFAVTLAVTGLLAVIYDGVVAVPVIHEARIVNDTMNVLSFVVLASFILTFSIARNAGLGLFRIAASVTASFALKTVAMIAFIGLRPHFIGATELFLLYVLYAFGAFTLHIMTVSSLFARMTSQAWEPAVDPNKFMSVARSRQLASRAIDGLRGTAILLIVIYHYVPTDYFSFSLGKPINAVLFTVAGYFFAALLIKHAGDLRGALLPRLGNIGRLLIARHVRIWPVVAVVVGLFVVLAVADGGSLTGQIFQTWPYYLSYLGNVPKLQFEGEAFPSHLWVIGVQEQWILLLLLIVAFFGLDRLRALLWPLVLFGIAARCVGVLLFMPEHPSWALETPLAVIDALALGMLARFAIADKVTRSRLRSLCWGAMLATICVWAFLPNYNAVYFTLVPLATTLLTAYMMVTLTDEARRHRTAQAFFGNPLLVLLGRISLSAFLLHPLINTVLRLAYTHYTGLLLPWWALSVFGPVLSFMAAWVSWRALEVPLRGLKGRLDGRARPAAQSSGRSDGTLLAAE